MDDLSLRPRRRLVAVLAVAAALVIAVAITSYWPQVYSAWVNHRLRGTWKLESGASPSFFELGRTRELHREQTVSFDQGRISTTVYKVWARASGYTRARISEESTSFEVHLRQLSIGWPAATRANVGFRFDGRDVLILQDGENELRLRRVSEAP